MGLPAKYDHLTTPKQIHEFYVREAQLDADAERDFFHPDYVHHTHESWQAPDFSGVLQSNERWENAISDLQMKVLLVTGEDDLIAVYKVFSGLHTGDTLGPPATGRHVTIPVMDFTRYKDRQMIEHWHVADFSELL